MENPATWPERCKQIADVMSKYDEEMSQPDPVFGGSIFLKIYEAVVEPLERELLSYRLAMEKAGEGLPYGFDVIREFRRLMKGGEQWQPNREAFDDALTGLEILLARVIHEKAERTREVMLHAITKYERDALHRQLEGCAIVARDYKEGVEFLKGDYGDEWKKVAICRQSLDDALREQRSAELEVRNKQVIEMLEAFISHDAIGYQRDKIFEIVDTLRKDLAKQSVQQAVTTTTNSKE